MFNMFTLFKKKSVWGRSYNNLPIKADYRVHDSAFEIIYNKLGSFNKIKALDLASGTGSFAKRLKDNFSEWEIEINDFYDDSLVSNFTKHKIDLNNNFSKNFLNFNYDLVISIEVLEHLENPWNFFRETRKLLKKGGVLILSTPNSNSMLDRLIYLIRGHSFYFGKSGFTNSDGHITQVPDWLLQKIAKSSGFSKVDLYDDVNTRPHMGLIATFKILTLMPLSFFFAKDRNNRSINIYSCTFDG